MIRAVLLIIAKKWKQYKCPSIDEWINNMKYYLAVKRNDILIHTKTWVSLENTMLSERSQSQKTRYYMIPFI